MVVSRHRKLVLAAFLVAAFPVLAGDVVATIASSRDVLLTPKHAAVTGEVVVSLQRTFAGGSIDKNSCRMMITIENWTPQMVGFFGQFNTYDNKKEITDVWFVAAAGLAAGKNTRRIFSCEAISQSVALFDRSPDGWPSRCEVNGVAMNPCGVPVRVISNLRVLSVTPDDPPSAAKPAENKH